ncbi:TonB-dependent receptor plug domain-containing protein [Novosphingobium bradum]|uniref:TonB-dependent receptor plug domain-containing protein n=1 Tax=Novosphingobium bradum TaxID=1737444 RepID=A0ABV7ILK8_9SPHN
MKTLLFLSAATLGLASPAFAADAASGDIVVTATRIAAPLSEVGQSVSVVTRAEIEQWQATQAVDVLARLPGIAVAASGGFGQPTSVFVRGADNAQSLVLIDGVRINDPADVGGGFDFGSLAVGQFDRIEVVRGSQSVLWGSRAIGGVINLITRQPTADWQGRAQAEYGWRNRKQLGASVSGMVGPVGLTAGGTWLKGDGFSAFSEARGATERDGFESVSGNLKAVVDLGGGLSADAGTFYSRATYGYDGFAKDALNFGAKRDVTGFANLRWTALDDRLTARLGYGLTDSHRVSDDAVYGPYITDGRNERVEGQVAFTPVKALTVLLGGETEYSRFKDNFGSAASTRIGSAFASATLRPLPGLTLNGGVRHDHHRDFGNRDTVSANGAWEVAGETGPVLRASYGEGFKAPSLYQLYTNTGFTALRPETAHGWDASVEQPFAAGHGRISLGWFDRRTQNLIDYDFATFTYYNVGKVRAKGVELAMQVTDWQGFDVNLSYTWSEARNQITGKQLARRPDHTFAASLDYHWAFGLVTGIDLNHAGERYDNTANTQLVPDYMTLALRASYPLTARVELFGRVENALDSTYEVVRTYGTPGRSAYAGVKARF